MVRYPFHQYLSFTEKDNKTLEEFSRVPLGCGHDVEHFHRNMRVNIMNEEAMANQDSSYVIIERADNGAKGTRFRTRRLYWDRKKSPYHDTCALPYSDLTIKQRLTVTNALIDTATAYFKTVTGQLPTGLLANGDFKFNSDVYNAVFRYNKKHGTNMMISHNPNRDISGPYIEEKPNLPSGFFSWVKKSAADLIS